MLFVFQPKERWSWETVSCSLLKVVKTTHYHNQVYFKISLSEEYRYMYDTDKRKLLSALAHGSIFFSLLGVSVGIPIAILFVSDDPVVKENAKEALNFHLNVWLYGIIFGVLTIVLIGFLLLGILQLVNVVLPILAILQALSNPDQAYRYPFIFRLL